MGQKKAQSAMEYLMTYGWALLLIAVVTSLLFEFGMFGGTNSSETACIAQSSYLCQNPILHNGNLTMSLGQSTGTNWKSANVILVEAGGGEPSLSSFEVAANTQGCEYTPSAGALEGRNNDANSIIPKSTIDLSFSVAISTTSTSTTTSTTTSTIATTSATTSIPNPNVPSGSYGSATLSYGMTGQGAITCTPLPSTPGSSVQGVIWVEYTTEYGSNQITNIATVSAVSK